MDFTEFQKSYITLHLTMYLTFEGGFPLTNFTKTIGTPQTWNYNWPDFGEITTKGHNELYWYEIPILRELAKQQYMFFGFKHTTDCI
jgi:hypothetical protein